MNIYKITFLFAVSLFYTDVKAKYNFHPSDSIPQTRIQSSNVFWNSPTLQIVLVPSFFFATSAALWKERGNIRDLRNRYIPEFEYSYDDYLQYAPTAAVYALKLSGNKGRNNIKRATISYGASLAIMGVLVNALKYTTKVQRPDQSSNNSFPSGHTSMAFTNASFLSKEYGMVNPLYSIGGYGAATFTGLGRSLNNRHWATDVVAGAGVGILSTQLGYFFIDKIYHNKGDNLGILADFEGNENPSFLAVKMGSAIAGKRFSRAQDREEIIKLGFEMGIEGAYFITPKWGVGAEISFSSFPINNSAVEEVDMFEGVRRLDIITQSIGTLNAGLGPYYHVELNEKWSAMFKTQYGYSFGSEGNISLRVEQNSGQTDEIKLETFSLSNTSRFTVGSALTYKFTDAIGLTAYLDYHYTRPVFTHVIAEELQSEFDAEELVERYKSAMDYIATGIKLTAYF